jgi:hypothetical protein
MLLLDYLDEIRKKTSTSSAIFFNIIGLGGIIFNLKKINYLNKSMKQKKIISIFGRAYNISEIKVYIKFVDKSVVKRTKKETSCLLVIDIRDQSFVRYVALRCFSVLLFLIKTYCLV